MAKKPVKKAAKKASPKKVVKNPHIAAKPNKQVGKPDVPKGTVKVKNIMPQPIKHWNGVIDVGKTGLVTPYEADLLKRKKHIE